MTVTMEEDNEDASAKLRLPEFDVKRCLFGRPDPEATRVDLERVWAELQLRSNVLWNFDFERGRPLVGALVWTRCDGGDGVDGWLHSAADEHHPICDHAGQQRLSDRRHAASRAIKSKRRPRQSRVTGAWPMIAYLYLHIRLFTSDTISRVEATKITSRENFVKVCTTKTFTESFDDSFSENFLAIS